MQQIMRTKNNRALILADGKIGHQNQSLSLVKLFGIPYEMVRVEFPNPLFRFLSYVLDWCGIYWVSLFRVGALPEDFSLVISAGSETYYANKVLARKRGAKSIALMRPRTYRLDFDYIIKGRHDEEIRKTAGSRVITLEGIVTYYTPDDLQQAKKAFSRRHTPSANCIGILIGGPNSQYRIDTAEICRYLEKIRTAHPGHEIYLSTSRRTPLDLEERLEGMGLDYCQLFSRDKFNPLPAWCSFCDKVFVTVDSVSMICEAVGIGKAPIHVIPMRPRSRRENKYTRILRNFQEKGLVNASGRHGQPNPDLQTLRELAGELEL